MDPALPFVLAVLGVAGLLIGVAVTRNKIGRSIRRAKHYRIADFPERTRGKIIGRVSYVEPPIEAPLSGRRCALYQATVWEQTGKSSYKLLDVHQGVTFLVEDESGRALIDPRHCRVTIALDVRTRSGPFRPAEPREERFLATYGEKSKGWLLNRPLSYREGVIEEGELVVVHGEVQLEPDPDGASAAEGYRELPPMRRTFRGSEKYPLELSDDPAYVVK